MVVAAERVSIFRETNGPIGEVPNSFELRRILALPRRKLPLGEIDATPLYRLPGGTMALRDIQSVMLAEAAQADGGFFSVGVGFGKTLAGLLLPDAMGSDKAVILMPSQTRYAFYEKLLPLYRKHFRIPPVYLYDPTATSFPNGIYVVTYEELSSVKKADALHRIDPDLVVCDEIHKLRNNSASRTKRFKHFFKTHPEVRLVGMSGTITSKSLMDFAHLITMILRKNSPVPTSFPEQLDWAAAIDVLDTEERRMAPGALMQLCERGEHVRSGFRRRLTDTRGCVATSEGAIGTSLIIRRVSVELDSQVRAVIDKTRETWSLGDEEYEDALTHARALRQLATGFYYKWVWPAGKRDSEWITARAEWHKEMREFLTRRARPGMDSPLLLAQAAASGRWEAEKWKAWDAVRNRPQPHVVAVWVSDFFVKDAIARARMSEVPTILWYEHKALGEAISESGGFPLYDSGTDPTDATARIIVCSIRAHGTGKNLQRYSHNLVLNWPPGGAVVEQLVGRTHRPGQEADEVTVDWYGHVDELQDAFVSSMKDAWYIQETQGAAQKLCYATIVD